MRKGKRSSVVVSRLYTMHTPHQGRDKHIQSGAASHTAPTTHDLYNVDSMEGQRQHCDCRSRGELVSAAGKGAWLPTTLHARHKQAALHARKEQAPLPVLTPWQRESRLRAVGARPSTPQQKENRQRAGPALAT